MSYLELLKNRLIYLSLKLEQPEYEKKRLRQSINDCWKAIYHSLGRNKAKPLDDDLFLGTHYLLYFLKPTESAAATTSDPESVTTAEFTLIYDRRLIRKRDHYTQLLQEIFVQKRVKPNDKSSKLDLSDIYDYVKSLQVAVDSWYSIFNPETILPSSLSGTWLDKLERIGNRPFLPLILSVMLKVDKEAERVQIFKALERHIFALGMLGNSYYNSDYYNGFLQEAVLLYHGKISARQVTTKITEATSMIVENPRFLVEARASFRQKGYYNWPYIRYFLYEYNLDLQEKSKTDRRKLYWSELNDKTSDYATVEHIYPQTARGSYWTNNFSGFTAKQRDYLKNSLGNLVPLSQPKNSSLSNRPFPEKVEGKKEAVVGFRFGCYAENEVAKEPEWNPECIKARGIKLLAFMEKRWGLRLGTETEKIEMLNLDFL